MSIPSRVGGLEFVGAQARSIPQPVIGCLLIAVPFRPTGHVESWRDGTVETIKLAIDPPYAHRSVRVVRALEAARDAQADPKASRHLQWRQLSQAVG